MMKGVRQSVKSCLRMEKRLLPPPIRHNTQRLMTALQPGRTLPLSESFFVFYIVETLELKEALRRLHFCQVHPETHLITCNSLVNLLAH